MRIACPLPEVGAVQLCRNFAFDVLDPVSLGAFFDGYVSGEVVAKIWLGDVTASISMGPCSEGVQVESPEAPSSGSGARMTHLHRHVTSPLAYLNGQFAPCLPLLCKQKKSSAVGIFVRPDRRQWFRSVDTFLRLKLRLSDVAHLLCALRPPLWSVSPAEKRSRHQESSRNDGFRMSQGRRGEVEQGQDFEEGSYVVWLRDTSIVATAGEDEELFPSLVGFAVAARTRGDAGLHYLVADGDMKEFLSNVCQKLRQEQDVLELSRETLALGESLERMRLENDAEKEELQRQLQRERQRAAEARRACADATRESERLAEFNASLQRDIREARRGENEARVEASSVHEKLRKTETAFAEAKKKFISAPDLVPCLQSLTHEVKTLQNDVKTTAEVMLTRPVEGRRSLKTLQQMKRVLHDMGRYPRRRRAKAADAADDGGGAMKRGRICYSCRSKGHLAKDCPRVRINTVASADPTTSDTHQRAEGSQEANAESGWSIFSVFRRTFTSGID